MANIVAQIRAYRTEINQVRVAAMNRNVRFSSMMREEMEAFIDGRRDIEALKQDKEKMTATTFMVEGDLVERFKTLAEEHGLSYDKALRLALRSIILNTAND